MGMKGGPHEGGPASYPVSWQKHLLTGTTIRSRMIVPDLPAQTDGITYYIWTDVFFGDAGLGRMNQLVPQLILGKALDGSSGPPDYKPQWGARHENWMFGSHYFFEIYNVTTESVDAHAAYGQLHPVEAGEVLWTEFKLEGGGDGCDADSPRWVLTMGVEGDYSRTSDLTIDRPYMGLGMDSSWGTNKTHSWAEESYHNLCINACWELYGADDARHLPSSGSSFDIAIAQPKPHAFDFLSDWEQDEGKVDGCPSSTVKEMHTSSIQHILWDIDVRVSPQEDKWETWKEQYYSGFSTLAGSTSMAPFNIDLSDREEERHRRGIFEDNIKRFESRGDRYVLDENAILTREEFRQLGKASCASTASNMHNDENTEPKVAKFSCKVLEVGRTANSTSVPGSIRGIDSATVGRRPTNPREIDYRGTQSTPVKNQGAFGTCWSFGFVETIEGLGVRQGHVLTNTSNQEVIDCCPECRGSAQDASFGFVIRNRDVHGRLATDDAYPYLGSPHNCSSAMIKRRQLAPAKVGGCVRVYDDEERSGDPIIFALSILGPAAFGIDASCLQGYANEGGIIMNCTDSQVNHEVLLVGADVDDETGVEYFLAKNR